MTPNPTAVITHPDAHASSHLAEFLLDRHECPDVTRASGVGIGSA
jgi:hypothetical protein